MLRVVVVVIALALFGEWTGKGWSQNLPPNSVAAQRDAAELAAFRATVRSTEVAEQQLSATNNNTTVAAIAAFMTAVAACAAAVAARSASKAIQLERAWIGAPTIEIVPDEPGTFAIRATVKNVGKTEVSGLYIRARFCQDRVWEELQSVINESKRAISYNKKNFHNHNIVPGSDFIIESDQTNEAFQPKFRFSDWHEKELLPYPHLVGCTLYKSGVDQTVRQTPFICAFRISQNGELLIRNTWTMDVT